MKLLFIFLFCLVSNTIYSQGISEWKAYSSFRSVFGIEKDSEDKTWIITEGGIAIYEQDSLMKTLSVVGGLSRLNGTTIEYDRISRKIFVGYIDGIIDVIDSESFEIQKLRDINRNDVFSSKSINKMLSFENSLFVGTDFGIVEYDLNTFFVKSSYLKLGDFDIGTSINDIINVDSSIYVASDEGIAYSQLDGSYSESDWSNYDQNSGLNSNAIQALGFYNGVLYASSNNENYIFENNNWEVNTEFSNNIILDYESTASKFVALAEKNVFIKEGAANFDSRFLASKVATRLNNSETGDILFGTLNDGIGVVDREDFSIEYLVVEGPFQNFFQGLNFDNGKLISSSSQKSSGNANIDRGKGFYIYDGNEWKNFNSYLNTEISSKGYQQAFTTTVTNDYYYFGSWGRGVSRVEKESLEIEVFDETNSTLRGWPADDPNYPVIIGLQTDSNDDVWIVSRFGGTPLYRQTPGDDEWQFFVEHSATTSSDLYEGLFIDSYDQKWIPLQNAQTSGTGLLIIDTQDPTNENDDLGVKLQTGSTNGNLPDNKVNALIEDKNGEVWIGTERGIAKFIFPELIVGGSVQERTAQWLINEDTSAVSRFLLRDINVSAMAVNEANEKWIGSTNQGIWVLNAEGTRIIKRFTSENSPLFSDNIESIAINDLTGEVFIATDVGLISYQDVPRKAVRKMDDLKVFPNPFSYSKHEEIFIEGLSEGSSVKVLGVDGTVVNTFETVGGRVSWDARDSNNNELGSGVYFIVAVDSDGNSKGVGKVIIVR